MSFKKLMPILFVMLSFGAKANYMLVQNVTKLGNNPANKTIQIQFDLSWQNSWRDSINWDAAWIFIKFKNANGLWQHARLNLAGFANGAGTSNTIKVGSDSVGAFVYRSALGSGNFNATSIQIQWNYGVSGLTDVSALEVRVFATEMVYVPEGDFNCAKVFTKNRASSNYGVFEAPPISNYIGSGALSTTSNFPVINSRLSPSFYYYDSNYVTIRIKGDAGIDTNNDGVIDNTTYPTGYKAFYCYKYEMSEQQYADFLNTLTPSQITFLGVAGTGITLNNGQYFSFTPNLACGKSNALRLIAFADWSGLRPISFLEFNKLSYGPLRPTLSTSVACGTCYPAWGTNTVSNLYDNSTTCCALINVGYYATSSTDRVGSGASYYGIMELTGNAKEPITMLNFFNFSAINGNGDLNTNGSSNVSNWSTSMISYIDQDDNYRGNANYQGFRYVRSAE